MDSLEKRAIMRVLPQLLEDVDTRNIVTELLEAGLVQPQDVPSILPSEVTLDPKNLATHEEYGDELRKKVNNLISILISKEDSKDGSLVKFINILKQDYEWLAEELKYQYDEEIKTGDRLRRYSGARSPFSSPLRPTYRNQSSVTMDYQTSLETTSNSSDSRESLDKKFYFRTYSQ